MSFQWGNSVSFRRSSAYSRTPVPFSQGHGSRPRSLAQRVLDDNYMASGELILSHLNTLEGQAKNNLSEKSIVNEAIEKIRSMPAYRRAMEAKRTRRMFSRYDSFY